MYSKLLTMIIALLISLGEPLSGQLASAEPSQPPRDIVTKTPRRPGPMGLFGPLRFGMSLSRARRAQPALSTLGESEGGPQRTPSGELWMRQRCPLHHEAMSAKGAFPWSWASGSSMNAYIECRGPIKSRDANTYSDLARVSLGDMTVELFDSRANHDAVLNDLMSRWGVPSQTRVKRGSDEERYYLWRNPQEQLCVMLMTRYVFKQPDYTLKVRRCWSTSALLEILLKAPKSAGALIGASLKELQRRYGEYAVRPTSSPHIMMLKVPMYEPHRLKGDLIEIRLKGGRVTRAAVQYSSSDPIYTVERAGHSARPLSDAMARALKGKAPPELIKQLTAEPPPSRGRRPARSWSQPPLLQLSNGLYARIRTRSGSAALIVGARTANSDGSGVVESRAGSSPQ